MRVGIVIPAWNMASWIAGAIQSVRDQTYTHWHMVVVDDGSTDETAGLVGEFADPRLTLVRQTNAGVSAARNRGLAELDADIEAVLYLDADDWLEPDALSRLVSALRAAPNAVASTGPCSVGERVLRPPSGHLVEALLLRNRFANGGHVLIRRSVTAEIGPFCRGLAYGEDWDYLIRLALCGRIVAVSGRAPLLQVRVRSDGACYRLATDPAAFATCLDVIFANRALLARLGPDRLAKFRRHAEAESEWIIGRELVRRGMRHAGLDWLHRSVRARPTLRRLVLLAAAQALPLLPTALRGPFTSYPACSHSG